MHTTGVFLVGILYNDGEYFPLVLKRLGSAVGDGLYLASGHDRWRGEMACWGATRELVESFPATCGSRVLSLVC
jgi:hypothetical protein